MATYAAAKDDFVYNELFNSMAEECARTRQQQCMRDVEKKGAKYARRAAEQNAVLDGQTAHLGGQHFVTSIGEAWASYYCRVIKVRARYTKGCYDTLPVDLLSHDRDRIARARRRPRNWQSKEAHRDRRSTDPEPPNEEEQEKELEFFLEPHTHRITTTAQARVCAPPLIPLYKNAMGRWISHEEETFNVASDPFVIEEMPWTPEPILTPL